MTVRLATGASLTVMKRVVGISYTLEEVQYDDDFIFLDLDENLMLYLVFTVAQKVRATSQLASTKCRYTRHLFTRRPPYERLRESTTMYMYYE